MCALTLFFVRMSAQNINNQISISILKYENSASVEEVLIAISNNSSNEILVTNIFVYSTKSKLIHLEFPNYTIGSGNVFTFTFRSIAGPSLFSDGWIVDMEYINKLDGRAYVKRVLKQANTFSTNTPLPDISDDSGEGTIDKDRIAVENSDGVTIYYNFINDKNELEVTSGDISYEGEVIIPEEVTYNNNSFKVTSIGEKAFQDCSRLTSLTISKSVKSIGDMAFIRCRSLTSVIIPNSVTRIGEKAFMDCSSLPSVIIPNNLTKIEYGTFAHCKGLSSVTIPSSVTSIGGASFYNCGLTSLTIPNSVTEIGGDSFYACDITSVTIPKSVKSIDGNTFSHCRKLTSITVENDNSVYDSRENCNAIISTETNQLISGCKNTLIPSSVTSIGIDAFSGCTDLHSIIIPNSVTSIGSRAFDSCSSLTTIEIPNNVMRIEGSTFSNCSSLISVMIPNSVIYIGDYAFEDCISLSSIIIPNSVTSMGNVVFNRCSSLASIYISNSLTSISRSTFVYCSNLKSITIPNSVTTIEDYAFYECSSLSSIIIGENVNQIGEEALSYCKGLKDVYCYAENVPITNYNSFNGYSINSNSSLHVPAKAIDLYKGTYPWSGFKTIVALTEEDPNPTGVHSLNTGDKFIPVEIYTMDGYRISTPRHGLNIIRINDGTIKKMMAK